MTTLKFLHAADIHLDSPLRGLARYEGVPADDVRLATRTALNNLVDAAIEEEVAFVVIAGDLYDGEWPHFGTGLFFCAAMGRLEKAGISVFLLYGNHDAESVLTKKLPLPANVQHFGTRKAVTFIYEATQVALHGWSYRDKDTRDNLAAAYPAPLANHFNIGVLHTALTGRPPHAPYAPCTLQELVAKGYDYWALGHAHEFEMVSERPMIVFPGNLQGRNIREVGPKGAVLVTVVDGAIAAAPQRLTLDAVRWARVDVDVAGVETEGDVHGRVRSALAQAFEDQADGRPLMARVTVNGQTSMHGDLNGRREILREEVRGIAVAISERLWIEKIDLRTTAPVTSLAQAADQRNELSELLAQGAEDDGLAAALNAEFAEFLAKIPPDVGRDDDLLSAVRRGDVKAVIKAAADALDSRLAADVG
ncbi:DNA repair exonuclease [Phenylobacterium sp. LjRoot225]|uniref:metallophosphoesterase family protein n=1 Tax=Phenylobacterium sp. LjRoot225 TaxID=3342285 RepID=UPI003ECFA8EB